MPDITIKRPGRGNKPPSIRRPHKKKTDKPAAPPLPSENRNDRSPDAAEDALRQHLSTTGKIDGVLDDVGLHRWLKNLNTVGGDHRNEWEKRLQARLAEELGLPA